MNIILIYTTNKNLAEAKKIANHLLRKKLIACANFFPIQSAYQWKGEVVNERETAAILKAPNKNWRKIKMEIKKMHSYKIPCIIKFSAEANNEYAKWINSVNA